MQAQPPESLLLRIEKSIDIDAPIATAFAALLEQIGPGSDTPDGRLLPMKLEPWPGGRWFRDLGNNSGHLWGHVQVIKPPTLLEIWGPLMMSYAAVNHVQYRLTEQGRGTRLSLIHTGHGNIAPEHRDGVTRGWGHIMSRIKDRAQSKN